jgi:hypothetical protein
MSDEFERVRASARHSRLGRLAAAARDTTIAAARSSNTAAAIRRASQAFIATPSAGRLRVVALALAVASAAHLLIRGVMSEAVVPAVPAAVFVVAGVLGALVAWQPGSFITAWRTSRVARLWRRAFPSHDPD